MLARTRDLVHPHCVACGRGCAHGLGLDFAVQQDGSVCADFACAACHEGYPGVLHGGVVSALLDAAMANCLFAHGIAAVTGELTVRFGRSVAVGSPVRVIGTKGRSSPPLHLMEARLEQHGQIVARGRGKFMELPGPGRRMS